MIGALLGAGITFAVLGAINKGLDPDGSIPLNTEYWLFAVMAVVASAELGSHTQSLIQ